MEKNSNITFQTIDYIIIASTATLILLSWIYAGISYADLPEIVPSHFNHKGEADGFSEKYIVWVISAIFTGLTVGMFFLAKWTTVHNVQLKSKEANFRSVALFMPYIAIIQLLAVYTMVQEAHGTFEYSGWVLPIILILTAVFLILMFVNISKNKKS